MTIFMGDLQWTFRLGSPGMNSGSSQVRLSAFADMRTAVVSLSSVHEGGHSLYRRPGFQSRELRLRRALDCLGAGHHHRPHPAAQDDGVKSGPQSARRDFANENSSVISVASALPHGTCRRGRSGRNGPAHWASEKRVGAVISRDLRRQREAQAEEAGGPGRPVARPGQARRAARRGPARNGGRPRRVQVHAPGQVEAAFRGRLDGCLGPQGDHARPVSRSPRYVHS